MRALHIGALATTLAVAVSSLVGVGPASAGTAERGRYVDPYNFDVDACGTPVNINGTTTGHFVGQLRGSNPVPFYVDHFVDRTTYTNLDTLRSYSTVSRITHVDTYFAQIDDTIISVAGNESGTFSVYDSAGNLYYRQAGLQQFSAVIDTQGTETDEDDVFLEFDLTVHGHFGDSDFCDDVDALTA
jgi:hypothetical protein